MSSEADQCDPVLGSKEQQLETERQEYLAAKLRYDKCAYAVSAMEREIADLQHQLAQLGNLASQYQSILDRKEKLILEANDENTKRLLRLSEQLADAQSDLKELDEAINAGNETLDSLEKVISSLKSASNWGTWDLLGGGMIATAIKHSRIDEARMSVHLAGLVVCRVFDCWVRRFTRRRLISW